MPVITVLQDHTKFMDRMYQSAMNHHDGLPLNVELLHEITVRRLGKKFEGRWRSLQELKQMGSKGTPSARKAAIAAAEAVEADVEAWYCVAPDEGLQWLKSNQVGPVLHWGDGWWWAKLKGVEVNAEIEFYNAGSGRNTGQPGDAASTKI